MQYNVDILTIHDCKGEDVCFISKIAGGCHTSRLTCGREKNIATACLQGYLAKTYLDEKFGTPEVFGWSHFKLISADSIVFYERE